MLAIQINVIWLPLTALGAGFLGFLLRSAQMQKSLKRIISLEKEMLNSHSEILSLQKELHTLQTDIQQSKTPVVSIKDAAAADENTEAKDGSRKKLGK